LESGVGYETSCLFEVWDAEKKEPSILKRSKKTVDNQASFGKIPA
jgi:hypothetical protein